MAAKKMIHIRGLLTNVSSQRTAYKPYGYSLDFSGNENGMARPVYVEFDIPEETVIEEADGIVTLGLEGLKAILKVTADAVDELNDEYLKKYGQ